MARQSVMRPSYESVNVLRGDQNAKKKKNQAKTKSFEVILKTNFKRNV